MNTCEELTLASLFTTEAITDFSTKNSSHGDEDFREAVFITTKSGTRLVIKAACNPFTTADTIKMWQRCTNEHIALGYYCPKILASTDGAFPTVMYKGHKCIAYAEEFSRYESADKKPGSTGYYDDIYRMMGRVAAQKFDYTTIPSGYCLFDLFPGDTMDEVTENALDFKEYCKSLPGHFHEQADRIFAGWEANRKTLHEVYFSLPFSVFQADCNDTNVLLDDDGHFVGIYDFNIAGRDELLNYLFREIFTGSFEEELTEILRALRIVSEVYTFSDEEIAAAPLIYRCVKPIWFTRVYDLKEVGEDEAAIQKCLDEMEFALTREIDFESVMRQEISDKL